MIAPPRMELMRPLITFELPHENFIYGAAVFFVVLCALALLVGWSAGRA